METIKPVYKWNGTLKKRTSTDFQIVHHAKASVCTVDDIHRWHQQRGWLGIGYNWLIRKDGTEWEGRPEWSSDSDAYGYNDNSLSICLEGNFLEEKITGPQRETLINRMVKNIIKYPKLKSLRHLDVNNTSCPGDIGWVNILAEVDERVREHKKELHNTNYKEKYIDLYKKYGELEEENEILKREKARLVKILERRKWR